MSDAVSLTMGNSVLVPGNHTSVDPQCIGYFLLGQLPLLPFSLEFLSKRHFGDHSCPQKACAIKLRKSMAKAFEVRIIMTEQSNCS